MVCDNTVIVTEINVPNVFDKIKQKSLFYPRHQQQKMSILSCNECPSY